MLQLRTRTETSFGTGAEALQRPCPARNTSPFWGREWHGFAALLSRVSVGFLGVQTVIERLQARAGMRGVKFLP